MEIVCDHIGDVLRGIRVNLCPSQPAMHRRSMMRGCDAQQRQPEYSACSDQDDPQDELREPHSADAYDLAQHELHGFGAGYEYLHDAVAFFLHHTAHDHRAIDDEQDIHPESDHIAKDHTDLCIGTFAVFL